MKTTCNNREREKERTGRIESARKGEVNRERKTRRRGENDVKEVKDRDSEEKDNQRQRGRERERERERSDEKARSKRP